MKTLACWNTERGMQYDYPAIEAAAIARGIDPAMLKDWAFEGITEDLTAEQIAQAYLDEQEAKS